MAEGETTQVLGLCLTFPIIHYSLLTINYLPVSVDGQTNL
jgi:hypothetical protein